MKKRTILFIITALTVIANAFAQTEADFTVELTADFAGAVIKGYTGTATQVRVPATIQGMPVKEIGEAAFYNKRIISVIIPEGVTVIGKSAFENSGQLVSVTIPNSITIISDRAFSECRALTTITIPNSVTAIGNLAFYECSRLESLTLPSGIKSIGIGAFASSGLKSFKWPASITKTQNGNFEGYSLGMLQGCSNLQTITIPEGVTEIGRYTFYGCTALTSVTIPNSVTTIGEQAFSYCSKIETITIPASVTSVGDLAFSHSGLKSITWPGSITKIKYGNNGEGIFRECRSLQTVIISEGVTEIGNNTFYACSALTSVTMPSTIKEISYYAFYNCSALTTIIIPDSVGNITFASSNWRDMDSFEGCQKLTLVSQAAVRKRGYTGKF
jgi:hypothetical protein